MAGSKTTRTFSFRALLATVLLSLLGGTVAVLVALSTWTASRNFRDLTQTISQQTLARVEANVQQLLQKAVDQNRQFVQLLGTRTPTVTNFPTIVEYLADSLKAQPSLARLTLVLNPSGQFAEAERLANDQIVLQEGLSADRGDLSVNRWEWRESQRMTREVTSVPATKIRDDEGFLQARTTERSVWTPAYPWHDPGLEVRWGIRYATPIKNPAGGVWSVCGVSLTLAELNRYLRQLDGEVPGYVVVIESAPAGQPHRIIGHPDPGLVGQIVGLTNGATGQSMEDGVLKAYLSALLRDPGLLGVESRSSDFGREFKYNSTRYLGSFRRLKSPNDPPWILAMLMPLSEVAGGVAQNLRWAAVAAASFFVLAALAALALARRIAEPMRQLSNDARALSHLQFEASPRPLSRVREVRQLEQALGDARSSLRSFRKYVPADVVNSLLENGVEAALGGVNAQLTILFSDVVDFTHLAESVSSQQLVENLGEYLAAISTVIQQHAGTVDKFIGDGVMAFWGAPKPNPNHARDGCVAAWRLQQRLDELNREWTAQGQLAFPTRIGLNTGTVIVGNIGSDTRMNYTAMGDPVNVASRLESLNRTFGTRILLSEETRAAAGDALLTRPVARVAVKGSERGFVVHELLGLEAEADADARRLAALTIPAFQACDEGRWVESLELYEAVRKAFPRDGVTLAQIEFVATCQTGPSSDSTAVIRRMTAK
ncbi:MAG TPA: adenylate/guanylate cyclase domain-containing protein [Verrucomicrobiota bacterium]|nr:adenylate/guanylate cyclase domain-containing protein [Verrucomicrobiota bacterium]